MRRKIRVAVIFGGKSGEHEVSLQSAKNVIEAIDKEKYEVVPIGIDKEGRWQMGNASELLLNADNPKLVKLNKGQGQVALVPQETGDRFITLRGAVSPGPIDVVFPVLHGPFGEDGTVQGLLELAGVPFVGAGVLGSALGMDKDAMKRLFREAGIPVAKFLVFKGSDEPVFETVQKALGVPFFVKPANLGSSVGISKVKERGQFQKAVKEAFEYDRKILIEEYIPGREIECSVMGNEDPVASVPGEIVPQEEFYSYHAKYVNENGAVLKVPAELPPEAVRRIQELAVKAFTTICCEGMARVDFFLKPDNGVVLNEINTIPGFTKISMYPKLWEASGVSYPELIDRLIQLAIERFEKEKRLKTSLI